MTQRFWLDITVTFLACWFGLNLSGCRRSHETPLVDAAVKMTPTGTSENERVFETRGLIRAIPAGGETLVVRHEAIPGYMPSMTMELNVRDSEELVSLKKDDLITFQLVARDEEHWIRHIRKVGQSTLPTAIPEPLVASQHIPPVQIGAEFPDVELIREDGRRIRLSSFRGNSVALTFFFTRCPLPEYCPRMLKNFRSARNQMLAAGKDATNWVFLAISFDSANDTPEILAKHARGYRGSSDIHWVFASAETNAMSVLIPSTQLMVAKEGESFSHNLRTVVLDGRGRLTRRFDGNEWTSEQLTEAVWSAAGKTASPSTENHGP